MQGGLAAARRPDVPPPRKSGPLRRGAPAAPELTRRPAPPGGSDRPRQLEEAALVPARAKADAEPKRASDDSGAPGRGLLRRRSAPPAVSARRAPRSTGQTNPSAQGTASATSLTRIGPRCHTASSRLPGTAPSRPSVTPEPS